MGLETATTIQGLDETWPTGLDPANQGDNHLRLIKQVLKDQFPGSGGQGFASPILANESELNYSVGLTDNIQDQINDLVNDVGIINDTSVPIGSVVMFNAAFAGIPSNWQLCDGSNGTPNMTDQFVYGTNTEGELLDAGGSADATLPSHTHVVGAVGNHNHNINTNSSESGSPPNTITGGDGTGNSGSQNSSGAGSHDHTLTTVGDDPTGKNIPPYIKLAYIQRMT